jgi:hypothetical protein
MPRVAGLQQGTTTGTSYSEYLLGLVACAALQWALGLCSDEWRACCMVFSAHCSPQIHANQGQITTAHCKGLPVHAVLSRANHCRGRALNRVTSPGGPGWGHYRGWGRGENWGRTFSHSYGGGWPRQKSNNRRAMAMISAPVGGGSTTLRWSNCSAYAVKLSPNPAQPNCGRPFE